MLQRLMVLTHLGHHEPRETSQGDFPGGDCYVLNQPEGCTLSMGEQCPLSMA